MGRERQPDPRVERLKEEKARIRQEHSRLPWGDLFRRKKEASPTPPVTDDNRLEKGDLLAMVLAVLSLVLPWVLAFIGALALAVWLFSLLFH